MFKIHSSNDSSAHLPYIIFSLLLDIVLDIFSPFTLR